MGKATTTTDPRKLSARQIGYLRRFPPYGSNSREASGPVKAMAGKFVRSEHLSTDGRGFVRTPLGDEAMASFEAGITHDERRILELLSAGGRVAVTDKGFKKLLDAELVFIGERSLRIGLTEAGHETVRRRVG